MQGCIRHYGTLTWRELESFNHFVLFEEATEELPLDSECVWMFQFALFLGSTVIAPWFTDPTAKYWRLFRLFPSVKCQSLFHVLMTASFPVLFCYPSASSFSCFWPVLFPYAQPRWACGIKALLHMQALAHKGQSCSHNWPYIWTFF